MPPACLAIQLLQRDGLADEKTFIIDPKKVHPFDYRLAILLAERFCHESSLTGDTDVEFFAIYRAISNRLSCQPSSDAEMKRAAYERLP